MLSRRLRSSGARRPKDKEQALLALFQVADPLQETCSPFGMQGLLKGLLRGGPHLTAPRLPEDTHAKCPRETVIHRPGATTPDLGPPSLSPRHPSAPAQFFWRPQDCPGDPSLPQMLPLLTPPLPVDLFYKPWGRFSSGSCF